MKQITITQTVHSPEWRVRNLADWKGNVTWWVLAASRLVTSCKCPELPSPAAECMDQILCWILCESFVSIQEYSVQKHTHINNGYSHHNSHMVYTNLHNPCNVDETSNFPALLWQQISLNYLCEIRSHPLNMIRWALELVWTFCRWENSLPLLEIKAKLLGCLACSLVILSTELPWLYYLYRILPLTADNL
jgi:hypothetical protein